jgi:hypothetical protein
VVVWVLGLLVVVGVVLGGLVWGVWVLLLFVLVLGDQLEVYEIVEVTRTL